MPPKKGRPSPPPPPRPAAMSLSFSSDSTLSLEPLVMLPPDGGYGWVVVATCFLMNLFTDGAIYTFGSERSALHTRGCICAALGGGGRGPWWPVSSRHACCRFLPEEHAG